MSSPFSKPFTLDRTVRLSLGLLLTFAIILLFRYLTPVLFPFLTAWLVAYIIHPIVLFSQKNLKIKNKTAAVLFVLTLIFAIISVSVYTLTPILTDQIIKLMNFIISYTNQSDSITNSWEVFFHDFIVQSKMKEIFETKDIQTILADIFPFAKTLLNQSAAITSFLITFFFTLLYLFFILKDYQLINQHFIALIPKKYQTFISGIMQDLEQGMSNYYRGQFLVVVILCILYATGFYLIDMPIGILMGLLVGLLNLIPYLQVISIPPCIILMLVHSVETGSQPLINLLLLFVVFVVIQIFQDGFLVPKIMGKKMGLNAALILLSLSIFGMLFGAVGLIIALPITTMLISYYKRFILKRVNEQHQRESGLSPETIEQLRI